MKNYYRVCIVTYAYPTHTDYRVYYHIYDTELDKLVYTLECDNYNLGRQLLDTLAEKLHETPRFYVNKYDDSITYLELDGLL